jgi:hypothetical protein
MSALARINAGSRINSGLMSDQQRIKTKFVIPNRAERPVRNLLFANESNCKHLGFTDP